MGVTGTSPANVFIGAPGRILFRGIDVGATTEGVTIRIMPDPVFTPQINGVPGLLAQTDYLQAERMEVEVTMLELSVQNIKAIIAGAEETVPDNGILTRVGKRRYPTSMYGDLLIDMRGLDTAELVLYFPNVTPTSGLEVTAGDDTAAAPTVTFEGRYKGTGAQWAIHRTAWGVPNFYVVAGLPASISTPEDVPYSISVRAIAKNGNTVTYTATGLPAGMAIDTDTGDITGTPTTPGGPDLVTVTLHAAGHANMDITTNWTVT
jgi:hypothetical protein